MADALASGASVRKDVGVQVPPRARILLSTIYLHEIEILVLCECCNVGHYLPWQLTTQRPLKQILCVGGVSQSIFTK